MLLAAAQHPGARETQQDAVRCELREDCAAAVICDGMDGMEAGELAASLAADTIFSALWEMPAGMDPERCLRNAALEADRRLAALAGPDGAPLDAGTTAVAVYVRGGEAAWLSAGDSRLYLWRDGGLLRLTRDHNYLLALMELVREGGLTREAALADPEGDALISYLGAGGPELVDTGVFPLAPGDTLLLCSDGLYKALDEEELADTLAMSSADPAGCAKNLVESAVRRGGIRQDNTTAALLRYGG